VPLSRARLRSVISSIAALVLLSTRVAAADPPTKQQCVVANETAQDLQRSGKLIQARLQLLTCAAGACPAAVRQDCAESLRAVEQAMPTVVLTPKDAVGGDASAAALTIDGVAQTVVLDGTPVAVDPGLHTFTVALTGRQTVSIRLLLKPGDRVVRDVVFKAASAAAKDVGSRSAGEAAAGPVSAPGGAEGNVRSVRRIAWSAIGAGGAGLTLGTIFGFLALGRKAALGRECRGTVCPEAAAGDIEGLHVNAVAANISFAIGLLGLGAGGALLLLYPEGPMTNSSPDGAAASVVGLWAGLGDVGVQGRFR
jgi:hypothetical protein